MMIGAGFIKDMINVTRNNRALLKGDKATYENFDKSAYPVKANRKRIQPKYKEATPEYLEQIRTNLKLENRRLATIHRWILGATVFIFGILLAIFLSCVVHTIPDL